MAYYCGTASFSSGTGSKSINLGVSGSTWIEIYFQGANVKQSHGFCDGAFQYVYSDPAGAITNYKCIQVRDTSGTVILEGTWTSFSGNNANQSLY